MKNYLKHHPWHIVEKNFHKDFHQVSESIYSLGNGRFGLRGNFEEEYSGKSLRGSYFAGIYYPDLTRVGWWKNGYPEYFAKVLNSVNWIGVRIIIDDHNLDLAQTEVVDFERILDMQNGLLIRSFKYYPHTGQSLIFRFERFCSMHDQDVAAINISVTSDGFAGNIRFEPYLNFDVHNEDANYGDQFWTAAGEFANEHGASVSAVTKKTNFAVTSFMNNVVTQNQNIVQPSDTSVSTMNVALRYDMQILNDETITLKKYIVNLSSLYITAATQSTTGFSKLQKITDQGFENLKQLHTAAWRKIWEGADIVIENDIPAQQGIRFNIFHLWQTYTGDDPRLNIGPKGFTGEKYGGSTYWDTEAYCIPFYLSTSDPQIARNLLVYRYLHLPKAIENAGKLGFNKGAALYPMVTINGEECHNEWEITFEEIHRNGAIVYAIFDYIKYTGDSGYLLEGGLEVIIGVARFWAQRANYSNEKEAWVILGVTGPNEYENNVNNNWYTNYIARWCLLYAIEQIDWSHEHHANAWSEIKKTTDYDVDEKPQWQEIADNMYFPFDVKRNIFLQQDGFLDKKIMAADQLPQSERPINQKWSWDRILRSCFIKQADVLQGMYFFEDHFENETIERHFDFYEPMTVHESSLSPCVHAILASHLGRMDKAVEMYLRTARLDLDDYNNDTEDGLHITSMAGTWMSIVRGFAGMSVKNGFLHFAPVVPPQWDSYTFKMRYRGRILQVEIDKFDTRVTRLIGESLTIKIGKEQRIV